MYFDPNFISCVGLAASLATIIAAFFVGAQAYIARKDFEARNKRSNVEKTSDLIRFYIDEILPYTGYINRVVELAKLKSIRDSLNPLKLVEFTQAELIGQLSLDDIGTYEELFSGELDDAILHQARYVLRTVDIAKNYEKGILGMFSFGASKKVGEFELNVEFAHIRSSILSNLEYFCMGFNEKIADDDIAYASIHQTFIPLVTTFYVYIARMNTDPDKKYYSQISKMYARWAKR